MIVRFGGGNKGIADYLEKGMKQSRFFSRDELDKRVILEGDLSLTDCIINSIEDKGQQRYLHITLSFREDEISNDTLQDIVGDYRELLMTAYDDDEFNFYAEAHLPKIKQVKDERTGEMIERKPHIHIVIPEINLLTFNKLSPVGLVEKHERHLDSIQEFINHKYKLESPKDYVRNTDMHYANVLSRVKGDFFGTKQQALKSQLVDEITKGQINNLAEFEQRLSNFGEVKTRNKGKANQYFAVKFEGDKKFTNFNHPIFNESFIVEKKLPYKKQSIEQINSDIADWKNRVSREIKHVNCASQSFRKLYSTAEQSEKKRLLADREANYERKYRTENRTRDFHEKGRSRNYKSNIDLNQEKKSGASSREASSLSSLSDSTLVHGENQGNRSTENVLSKNEHADLRNRKSSNYFAMRWHDSSRAGINEYVEIITKQNESLTPIRSFSQLKRSTPTKTYSKNIFDKTIEQRPFVSEFEKYQTQLSATPYTKFSDSNTLSFMRKKHLSEQEKNDPQTNFADIKKNIDPHAFLTHLEHVYGIDRKKHSITYAKDGSPRFSVNRRNLNASDFLTKYLNLEWKEAKFVLSYVYERQANKNFSQEKLSTLAIQRNIKSFTDEIGKFEKDIKLSLYNLNVDNRNFYRGEKKRIFERFSNPKQRNQELVIASFRAMQRQEQINEFEKFLKSTLEREKISFQQSGYSNKALEDSIMAFKDSFNLALGDGFGRVSPGNENISFADNFRQQQAILYRQLKEKQNQEENANQTDQPFRSKALEEVIKLNNLGISKKENGDIEYKRLSDGKTICTDTGNQMLISKDMQSAENVKIFLELSIDKYGNELKINGSKEFKEMVIETAVVNNLSIILKPASLQSRLMEKRKELQLEAKAQSLNSVTNEAEKQLKPQSKVESSKQDIKEIKHSRYEERSDKSKAIKDKQNEQYSKSKQVNDRNKTYDIKFTFDCKEANYKVFINGESAKSFIAKDPNALTVLKNYADIKKHKVPTSELQAGVITRTESMKGGNRPKDIKFNAIGQEIKQEKIKDHGMER